MIFDDLNVGDSVFVDANVFLYYFTAHPTFGPTCNKLFDRIDNQEIHGYSSVHVLGEVIHRLMTIEACDRFSLPVKGIAQRLRKLPKEVQQLTRHKQAIDEIKLIGIDVLPIREPLPSRSIDISQQAGLLYGDALIVAVMQDAGLSLLASNDDDFDRVPGVDRYAPT